MTSGSLNNPSLVWLDEGEAGADCSVLSSGWSFWSEIKKNRIDNEILTATFTSNHPEAGKQFDLRQICCIYTDQ